MRSKLWLLSVAALIFLLSAMKASAQGCITFQPDFSAYTDESTDGTNIYTSVTIDGTGDMIIASGCYTPPNIIHTASADNVIGTTGGWGPGDSGCPDCYLSSTNNQEVPYLGQNYNFQWSVQAICSVAGPVWGSGGAGTVGVSVGNFLNSGPGGIYPNGCLFKLSCPNGTKSECAPSSVSTQGSDCNYTYDHEYYLTWTPAGGQTDCFAPNLGKVSDSPVNCH